VASTIPRTGAALVLALFIALTAGCGGSGGGGVTTVAPPAAGTDTTAGAYADANSYSSAALAYLTAPNEGAAVIASKITLNGKPFNYTATTGHLTASDLKTGQPSASFFYVAYTVPGADPARRPVTFFYNGGPGSSTMWLHLGSFGPRRVVTGIPSSTIPAAQLVDNQETLLEQSDLVFVDAIGTGYSQAIAPNYNMSFWGVDADAAAFRDFIRRYLDVNQRGASPKFLYGESYGTPRTAVLANLLESAGVPVDGIMLQSAVMNYNTNCGLYEKTTISCEGYLPTYAATSAYYQRSNPPPTDLGSYLQQARAFAAGSYRTALASYLASNVAPPAAVVSQLVGYTGMSTLIWQQNFNLQPGLYQTNAVPNMMVGRYDARVSAPLGSALTADGDPSYTVTNGLFTSLLPAYLSGELHYSARSAYAASINIVSSWNFRHDGKSLPDTIPDLAAALAQHPNMKIIALNGYYDLATPYYQTEMDLARLGAVAGLSYKYYGAGHMSYLDDGVRKTQLADLAAFYHSVTAGR
jgi:carboxypeptidase C (cathepsin A)